MPLINFFAENLDCTDGMEYVFASLARIRILILPVGNIERPSFEKWASEIKEFEEIKLSDIPADSRDDRGISVSDPASTPP